MGVNIIRSPGRIYTFQRLIFFKKMRDESQIISKITVKSTPRNSPIPKPCHAIMAKNAINTKKMWWLSQNMAIFCARSLTLAPQPGGIRQRDELSAIFQRHTG
ncbi:hypothetical protein CEP66_08320 [Citrobacter koseri]|nr:hypothetical protein CEP66_08320 [Citrobacter koseri]OFV10337.1 hypothetical protein HMPREF3126_16525 [Salmonella sp. HMSC13B08]ATF99499.1 hypothetical protein CO700_21915 [Citrobacter koseri]AVE57771.1 hypothetical protein AM352_04895 [Citrobacter koseri]AVE66381.1 hypothetical protein AM351_00405 [Citrobacter koseri]